MHKGLQESVAPKMSLFPLADGSRHIADFHWNRMKTGEKSKADFGFRRNRPFAAGAKNL